VKWGVDVQEAGLRDGARPGDPGFGEEPRESWGLLGSDEDAERVPTAPGRYVTFYEELEAAIRARGSGASAPSPVPLEDGIATLRVIESAQESARQGGAVRI
jgi:predicted dehydrogenase